MKEKKIKLCIEPPEPPNPCEGCKDFKECSDSAWFEVCPEAASYDGAMAERERWKEVDIDKMFKTYDKYIKLLLEELNETSSTAWIHGWRSSRAAQGEKCRKEIRKLRELYIIKHQTYT